MTSGTEPTEDWRDADWGKGEGLLPAIVQDAATGQVLMLGYMNKAALAQTIETQKVTFYSRSKNRLWTKGETSGNWLDFISAEWIAMPIQFLCRHGRTARHAIPARKHVSMTIRPAISHFWIIYRR